MLNLLQSMLNFHEQFLSPLLQFYWMTRFVCKSYSCQPRTVKTTDACLWFWQFYLAYSVIHCNSLDSFPSVHAEFIVCLKVKWIELYRQIRIVTVMLLVHSVFYVRITMHSSMAISLLPFQEESIIFFFQSRSTQAKIGVLSKCVCLNTVMIDIFFFGALQYLWCMYDA